MGEIIFYIITLCMGIINFFMAIEAPNKVFQFILQAMSKISSVFVILYSGVQLFKIFKII
jgi:uncharacterized membrane protein SirB2